MIEKLLGRFGYVKVVRDIDKEPFTQDEILSMYIENLPDTYLSTEEQDRLFQELKEVDGFIRWIDSIHSGDVNRHFSAINDTQRASIRGMFQRLLDIKKRCINPEKPKVTKITGIRYGI